MKKYALKNCLNEKIAFTEAEDITEAEFHFSMIKVLDISELLKIFIVEEIKEKVHN